MPWVPPDGLGKDHYNRLNLDGLMSDAQADVDRITQQMGDLGGRPDVIGSLGSQLAAATHKLDGLKAVNAAINPPKFLPSGRPNPEAAIPRYLGLLDDQGHAAVTLQNPDNARVTATFVPGTGQDINAMEGSNNKSLAMYQATLEADRSLRPEDVSVTTWMDYNRPMNLAEAALPTYATADGHKLDAFQNGLRVTHDERTLTEHRDRPQLRLHTGRCGCLVRQPPRRGQRDRRRQPGHARAEQPVCWTWPLALRCSRLAPTMTSSAWPPI